MFHFYPNKIKAITENMTIYTPESVKMNRCPCKLKFISFRVFKCMLLFFRLKLL